MADPGVDSSSIGARCAYCRTPWTAADAVKCPECDTVSHRECWVENGGCPILSCAAAPRDEVAPAVSPGAWGHAVGTWPAASHNAPQQSWTAATANTRNPPSALPAFNPRSTPEPAGNAPVDESTLRRSDRPAGATGAPETHPEAATPDTGVDDQPWWSSAASGTGSEPASTSWDASEEGMPQQWVTQEQVPQRQSTASPVTPQQVSPQAMTPQAASQTTPSLPASGWYPDPYSQHHLRWWDGQNWSDHTHPR